jgi:hypothetical protein
MVSKTDFGIDKPLLKEISDLSKHQFSDSFLTKIREKYEGDPSKYDRYMIWDQVLFCKNDRTHPYWGAMLPRNLEYRIIKYVHTILRHQGTDKCVCQISHTFYLKNLGRKVRQFV